MAIFDFESISVENEKVQGHQSNKWVEKHNPFSVSILFILIQELTFLYNPILCDFVSSFIDALEKFALQSKAQMKFIFLQVETAIQSRLARILKTLNQRRSHCVGIDTKDGISDNSSTQLLQMKKNQLIDLQEHFER